ncbi:hypothetical protein FHX52_2995 [Humibacillus xanthopallidus]|uniref:Nephrocystin 3-like N-terminal domain-containing protein n=2 Tax=Humibacillus xanthopallidus TaxID=412689 RepID=A0A543PQE7_9MICO|nr:hypothetical protein FHX52_2995 [Humibacillus xanthopallidus]
MARDGARVEETLPSVVMVTTITTDGSHVIGSGVLLADGILLSARHVLSGALSATASVLGTDGQMTDHHIDLPSQHDENNLSFVSVPSLREDAQTSVRLGVLSQSAPARVSVQVVGFPINKKRRGKASGKPSLAIREIGVFAGYVSRLSNQRTGTMEVVLEDRYPPSEVGESPWAGLSGGGVWAEGCLVGVVDKHYPSEGPNVLTVIPIFSDRDSPVLPNSAVRARGSLWRITGFGAIPYEAVSSRRQTRGLAPSELRERDQEVADLRRRIADGTAIAWYRGASFSGKTAFLAWCVENALDDYDVASCFIRSTGQRNRPEYILRSFHSQLSELAGLEAPPPMLLGELLDSLKGLIRVSAKVSSDRHRPLVIVLDGLDEYYDRRRLYELIEWALEPLNQNVSIILSSRQNVETDLDEVTVLNQSVLQFEPCPSSIAAEIDVTREVQAALESESGIGRWVLGALAVHTAGLSESDMLRLLQSCRGAPTDLTLQQIHDVGLSRSVVRAGQGDSAQLRLAHDAVLTRARRDLQPEIQLIQDGTLSWLKIWSQAGWPEESPLALLSPLAITLCDWLSPRHGGAEPSTLVLDQLLYLLTDQGWLDRSAIEFDGEVSLPALIHQIQFAIQEMSQRGDLANAETLKYLGRFGLLQSPSSRGYMVAVESLCRALAYAGQASLAVRNAGSIRNAHHRDALLTELAIVAARQGQTELAMATARTIESLMWRANAFASVARTVVLVNPELALEGAEISGSLLLEADSSRPSWHVRSRLAVVYMLLDRPDESRTALEPLNGEHLALSLREIHAVTGKIPVELDELFQSSLRSLRTDNVGAQARARAGAHLVPVLAERDPGASSSLVDEVIRSISSLPDSTARSSCAALLANALGRAGSVAQAYAICQTIENSFSRGLALARLSQRAIGDNATFYESIYAEASRLCLTVHRRAQVQIFSRLAQTAWTSGHDVAGERAFNKAVAVALRMRSAPARLAALSEVSRLSFYADKDEATQQVLRLAQQQVVGEPHALQAIMSAFLVVRRLHALNSEPIVSLRQTFELARARLGGRQLGQVCNVLVAVAGSTGDIDLARAAVQSCPEGVERIRLLIRLIVEAPDRFAWTEVLGALQSLEQASLGGTKHRDLRLLLAQSYGELGMHAAARALLSDLASSRLEARSRVPGGRAPRETIAQIAFTLRILESAYIDPKLAQSLATRAADQILAIRADRRDRPLLAMSLLRLRPLPPVSAVDGLVEVVLTAASTDDVSRATTLFRVRAARLLWELGKEGPSASLREGVYADVATLSGAARASVSLEIAKLECDRGESGTVTEWADQALSAVVSSRDPFAIAEWSAQAISWEALPDSVREQALQQLLMSGYSKLHLHVLPDWLAVEMAGKGASPPVSPESIAPANLPSVG